MLLNAGGFMGLVSSYRLVWLLGRVGGGKTSFAYRIAYDFLKQGYRLVTNNRCVWADEMKDVKLGTDGLLRCVVVLDEGGQYFRTGRQVEMIASYPAKMDVVYLIPSFWPPTRAAQVLCVQPMFSFNAAGIPLIFYRWSVRMGGWKDGGWFAWLLPQEIYGVYSRQDPSAGAEEIVTWLVERTEEFRAYYGRGERIQGMDQAGGEAELFSDSADAIVEASDNLASVFGRAGRRRKA